jgi:hypothetical protein
MGSTLILMWVDYPCDGGTDDAAGLKVPDDFAGQNIVQGTPNVEVAMSVARFSFAVLRFGVLRFCCSAERRRRRTSLSDRLNKSHFKTALAHRY